MLMRLYLFVDDTRTVLLRGLDQDSGNPADWEESAELFDAIGASVRPLEVERTKRKKGKKKGEKKEREKD